MISTASRLNFPANCFAYLFLDEFPEFSTRVLEGMRQLMEDKVVTIGRAKGLLTFSANFPPTPP